MPWLLYPHHPLDRRLAGSQSWSGSDGGEETKVPTLPLLRIKPQSSSL